MTTPAPIVALLCFGLLAAFLAYSRHVRLRKSVDIISALHPHVLQELDGYLNLSFDDDAEFWNLSRGYAGMRERRDNARNLLHLFQAMVKSKVVESHELAFLSGRAHLIVLFSFTAMGEKLIHKAAPSSPHISPRIVAILYSQMQARVKTLAAQYSPVTFGKLDAVL